MGTVVEFKQATTEPSVDEPVKRIITMEDGHTRIAHGLLEELMQSKYKFSGREYAVLLVIIRKTYGYMKSEDWIALSQFELMTGIAKSNCVKVIRGLVDRKIIYRTSNGNDQRLAININVNEWLLESPYKTAQAAKRKGKIYKQSNSTISASDSTISASDSTISASDSTPTIDKDKNNISKDIVPANAETAPTTKKRSFKFEEDDLAFAHQMSAAIAQVTGYENKRINLESWANDIRLMRERDGHTPEQIASLFQFANTHPVNSGGFSWSTVILSPDKLRNKWPQLMAQYRSGANAPQQHRQHRSTYDRLTDTSWDEGLTVDFGE